MTWGEYGGEKEGREKETREKEREERKGNCKGRRGGVGSGGGLCRCGLTGVGTAWSGSNAFVLLREYVTAIGSRLHMASGLLVCPQLAAPSNSR